MVAKIFVAIHDWPSTNGIRDISIVMLLGEQYIEARVNRDGPTRTWSHKAYPETRHQYKGRLVTAEW